MAGAHHLISLYLGKGQHPRYHNGGHALGCFAVHLQAPQGFDRLESQVCIKAKANIDEAVPKDPCEDCSCIGEGNVVVAVQDALDLSPSLTILAN